MLLPRFEINSKWDEISLIGADRAKNMKDASTLSIFAFSRSQCHQSQRILYVHTEAVFMYPATQHDK